MLGTINLRFVVIVSALTLSFFSGWYVNGWRWESKAFKNEQKLLKTAEDAQKLAVEYELLKQTKDAKQNVITKEVYIETSKPAYDCRIPDAGMLILHKAVETANSGKSSK